MIHYRLFLAFIFTLTLAPVKYGRAQQSDFTEIDFSDADSIASRYAGHSLENLHVLSQKLTGPLHTEPEKFRAIFKWVCLNITNDYNLYTANKRNRETLSGDELKAWNKSFNAVAFKRLMDRHATVCTGYAYLIRELSLHASLSCEIIDGYGRNVVANIGGKGIANHSWNAVKLYEKWYLCDPTWASGSIDPLKKSFIQHYNDAYFLSDPALFLRNHYPLDATWSLIEHPPTLTNFLNGPLIYVAAIREHIETIRPNTFESTIQKGSRLTLTLQGPSDLAKGLSLLVGNRKTSHEIAFEPTSGDEFRYEISHVFRLKGSFAVHVLMNDDHLYTYHVTVK